MEEHVLASWAEKEESREALLQTELNQKLKKRKNCVFTVCLAAR